MASSDHKALQFAGLEVKRDRTLADLDGIQAASRDVFEALKRHLPGEGEKLHAFISELGSEEASQPDVRARWKAAFASSSPEFHELVDEWLNLSLQERILRRMMETIDQQLALLRRELE